MATQVSSPSLIELSADELNESEKKSAFIEVVNDDEQQTLAQDLVSITSLNNLKKEAVA